MARILVVGDVVDDIIVRPLTTVTYASDTNAEIQMTSGGSAANVAAWLGRLGADVMFVGRAGTSGVQRHRDALAAFGVDARIVADPDRRTATIVLTLDDRAERTMYVDRGANVSLRPTDVPEDAWEELNWLHLTGYSFFDDAVRPTALALIARARAHGVGVSVDPSSVGFLRDCGAEAFLGWTSDADLVFPNEDEAVALTGRTDMHDAALTLRQTYETVVLTRGTRGSLLAGPGGSVTAGTCEGEVVDSTGAGDAFAAGFLSTWTAGAGSEASMESGARTAAEAVGITGARPVRR